MVVITKAHPYDRLFFYSLKELNYNLDDPNSLEFEALRYPWEYREDSKYAVKPMLKFGNYY